MFKLWKGLKKDRDEKRLDEVVKNKESHKQKLEAEDAQYLEKRKERARKIIQYEKEELDRREEEVSKLQTDYDKVQKGNEENEDELQGRIKALQMELDDMRLENRSKEGEMTRELDTRRATIQELRMSIAKREEEIGEKEVQEVLKEPRRTGSAFRKSVSASDVPSMETRARAQSSAYSSSTYNPASNPFYPALDTTETPAFTDGARGFTDGAAGFTPAPMAGINTILVAKSNLKESPVSIYSSCDSLTQFDSVSLAPTLISDHPLQRVRSLKETESTPGPIPSPRSRKKASAPPPPDSPLPPAPSSPPLHQFPSLSELPDLEQEEQIYPSVPELEPGQGREEDDLYVTLERPKKKKRERRMEAAM